MTDKRTEEPDSTAVRVALWRAMHAQIDPPPHILEDEIGLKLISPPDSWRERPDMDPVGTKLFRASIVARARFIEELVAQESARGVNQYIILGAGLDSFAQRKPELASRLQIFEVDQPGTQKWKRRRLIECDFAMPDWLHFVPVNFEAGDSWTSNLVSSGFDNFKPAVVSSTGVTMYLTRQAITNTLSEIAQLAPGSTLAMTFILPMDMADPEERAVFEAAAKGAQASGTPFLSFFTPDEMLEMARECGFKTVQHVPASELKRRYFSGRIDGLRPGNSESVLVATV